MDFHKRESWHNNCQKSALSKHGYLQSKITPGLWKHKRRPICFTLVVDYLGVKYQGKEHTYHLVSLLKEHYEILEYWDDKKDVVLTFDWYYEVRKMHLSILGYV